MRDYSYSRLGLFESCPAAFAKKYVERVPESPSEALAFGGLIHRIIAAYTRHCLERGIQTDVSAVPDLVQQCFYDQPAGISSNRFGEVLDLAQQFASTHLVDIETLVGIEEWVEQWLAGRKYLFRGIIDRLNIKDQMAIITDYKTDFALRPQSEVERDFQLVVYAWLVSLEYPQVERFEVQLDFVRFNVQRGTVLEREQVVQVEKQILGLINQIETAITRRQFPARPGHFCAWCGYTSSCPAVKEIPAEVRPIVSEEDARKVAEELAVLERQVALRKEALKAYCAQAGHVEANGLTWGFHPVGGLAIEDVDAFVRIMNEHGLDPRPYLNTDGRKLKKLWNQPELAEKLREIAVDRTSTRFEAKKSAGGAA